MERKRWIGNMIKATEKLDVKMPWERGARRAEMIRRRAPQVKRA